MYHLFLNVNDHRKWKISKRYITEVSDKRSNKSCVNVYFLRLWYYCLVQCNIWMLFTIIL